MVRFDAMLATSAIQRTGIELGGVCPGPRPRRRHPKEAVKDILQVIRGDHIHNGCTARVRERVGLEVCEGDRGGAPLHRIVA
jgi:hypothetical protein